MSGFGRGVLSERVQEAMAGRRIRSAVFLTYDLEPGFFEREVLPVFFDQAFSHVPDVRHMQLEDVVRAHSAQLAVYYDPRAVRDGIDGSAKLDISRIPVTARRGRYAFHPKNCLVLCDDINATGEIIGESLVILTASANLTRSGWWENAEGAQITIVSSGATSRMASDLVRFLRRLRSMARRQADRQTAMDDILKFLTRSVRPSRYRSSDGVLHTRFYGGQQSVVDFLDDAAAQHLEGMNLDVISPFLDNADRCESLSAIVGKFGLRDVRVLLPVYRGAVTCRPEMYDSVIEELGATWGRLPSSFLRTGKARDAMERRVHAKIYRFWSERPRREILLVGSVNLTTAGHAGNQNIESAVLVESTPTSRLTSWLELHPDRPSHFADPLDEESDVPGASYIPLVLRYDWHTNILSALWVSDDPSPDMTVNSGSIPVLAIDPLRPYEFTELKQAPDFGERLRVTSVFQVKLATGESGPVLVQEVAMAYRPSVIEDLTPTQILEYWSLLTPEQRAAYFERLPQVASRSADEPLVSGIELAKVAESMFERFAGMFHGFTALRRHVLRALESGDDREATYRVFGRKYDSLGTLLDSLTAQTSDPLDAYLMLLCARQFCDELRRDWPDFWRSDPSGALRLIRQLASVDIVRNQLLARNDEEIQDYLQWFEKWFLKRVQPQEMV